MTDSGIDIDFSSLLSAEDSPTEGQYYELKSNTIIQSPKTTEIKNASMAMRTNLKLQLMRQQAEEEEKRERQYSQSLKTSYIPTSGIDVPPQTSHTSEVPPQVLQVRTKLENPTRYHVIQKQKNQIESYLSQSQGNHTGIQSMPNVRLTSTSDIPQHMHSGSAPVDPDSPLSVGMSSTATSISEVESILNDLQDLESVDTNFDDDLKFITPSLVQMSSTNPATNDYVFTPVGAAVTSAKSAPTVLPGQRIATPTSFLTEDDARMWAKERQKKDNHNMIERRRRFNINDRIKELGTMLPRHIDPDLRQNKGSILKASVDYIKKLKRDQERLKQIEEKQRQTELQNRKMMLRVQQLELLMKAQGLNTGFSDDIHSLTTLVQPNTVNNLTVRQQQVRQERNNSAPNFQNIQQDIPVTVATTLNLDDIMDDSSSGLSADPMLSSHPVSPSMDDESMDYGL
ncbi:microphthalmia-associated transcription factor-like isoform X2 [Mercenaria mercenaria]|uniref:microphthalmia-associated transcription factor-like isoform X2 n=1 Tax=Mercenaria mercenaria TaxID=6596 RepID=UPI001E1DE084|nr:microphthalmia-associated transcription factor-like isoform X2 [Mercenaria mercenaria]